MDRLREKLKELTGRVVQNNLWRQRECFNLIPSETTPSLMVKVCEISDPAGRYAEHRTMRGDEVYFYQGIDFIREIEIELKAELSRFFSAPLVEIRPISGQMANEIVFKAMVKYVNVERGTDGGFRRMGGVMNNDLSLGGHLSAQPMGSLFNFVDRDQSTGKERVINFPVRREDPYRIDSDQMARLIEEERPDLIIFGKSMFIYPEPVRKAMEVAMSLDPAPLIMYDMAHVLGLYGAFQSPLDEGADVVTGSTHKTFFGPQRGVIVSNLDTDSEKGRLWKQIVNRAFPGSTSNHHLGTLLALLVATSEMNAFKGEYQGQVIRNSKAFARAMVEQGVDVEGDSSYDYSETHQVLIRVEGDGMGTEVSRRLETNNIVTNYQALPGDKSFLEPSGIRMGTQEMTRFGMMEDDFGRLAEIIAEVVLRDRDVRADVKEFRKKFQEMRFTLPLEESVNLAAEILSSNFPSSEYAERFAENLQGVSRGGKRRQTP